MIWSSLLFAAAGVAAGGKAQAQESYWPRSAMCVSDQPDGGSGVGKWGNGHGQNHDWYRLLHDHRGVSCCNGDASHGDCRPAQARQDVEGNWTVYLGGQWVSVPPQAVLDSSLNRQPLHAHICAAKQSNYIYCFIPGADGS